MTATLTTTKDTADTVETLYEAPAQELGHSDNDAPAVLDAPEGFTPDTAEKCDWVLGKIADDRAALVWAKANLPAAIVERIDRAAIGKALIETGECVDFAAFTPSEEAFYIK